MINEIAHVGVTVSNIEKSIEFYRDVLGLKYKGRLTMKGAETDILFGINNCNVEVAYLNGSDELIAPPIELIEFVHDSEKDKLKQDIRLNNISIFEICFKVYDINKVYLDLLNKGVEFISEPQIFDFEEYGFGKSKAVYFKDPDGIILELLEVL